MTGAQFGIYNMAVLLEVRARMGEDIEKPDEVRHFKLAQTHFEDSSPPTEKCAAPSKATSSTGASNHTPEPVPFLLPEPPLPSKQAQGGLANQRPQAAPAAPAVAQPSSAAPAARSQPRQPAADPAMEQKLRETAGVCPGGPIQWADAVGFAGRWWLTEQEVTVSSESSLLSKKVGKIGKDMPMRQVGTAVRYVAGPADLLSVVRLPVNPPGNRGVLGWVTLAAQGEQRFRPAQLWRVVHQSAVVRTAADRGSQQLSSLSYGDVVQQVGPENEEGGMRHMPIAWPPLRKAQQQNVAADVEHGWVTTIRGSHEYIVRTEANVWE